MAKKSIALSVSIVIGLGVWVIESYRFIMPSIYLHTDISRILSLRSMKDEHTRLLDRIAEQFFQREKEAAIRIILKEVAMVFHERRISRRNETDRIPCLIIDILNILPYLVSVV